MKPESHESQAPLLLLGEQRERSRLRECLDRWQVGGPVALVSAGWEEDETDDGWVRDAAGREVVNGLLYGLADQMFAEDPEVLGLLRERQDELRRLRDVNKIQLDHQLAVCRELLRREFAGEDVRVPLASAIEYVRTIDRDYLGLVTGLIERYDRRIDPEHRDAVRIYRNRVLERLHRCEVLLIAGGHAGVLLNRLSLSQLLNHARVPVIAWSGGAMVMGGRVVFYHQFLPHGSGDSELSRQGMGWFGSTLLFPRAEQRLKLDCRIEVALLARRFGDETCLAMNPDSIMEWRGGNLVHAALLRRLEPDGMVREWRHR